MTASSSFGVGDAELLDIKYILQPDKDRPPGLEIMRLSSENTCFERCLFIFFKEVIMRYWLFKSEPDCYSVADLAAAPDHTTGWDGVRNYQARNFMRDEMKTGDLGFFYHSGKTPEIVGLVEIVREGHPDPTATDPENQHFDPAATEDNPRWFMVDVRLVRRFDPPIPRGLLRSLPELAGMELLKQGSRLSVQPVEEKAFRAIVSLADKMATDGTNL